MSEYVYESGMSTQRRKQRRTAITLMLTLLLLFGAFWWAWAYIRSDGDAAAGDSPTQTPTPTAATCVGGHDPKPITVNVYNATRTSGLARRAADELAEAGFVKIGEVANDPMTDREVTVPIEVRYGVPGQPFAETFRDAYVPEATVFGPVREGGAIDVVLGPGFTSFGEIPDLPPCENG
ncbi:MAG: LytR C-terminal domain-containing protein [Actinomycetia bacterium]|nr:LytR C-terminal domain-containing protein [Actinomycetes bacterium]